MSTSNTHAARGCLCRQSVLAPSSDQSQTWGSEVCEWISQPPRADHSGLSDKATLGQNIAVGSEIPARPIEVQMGFCSPTDLDGVRGL